MIKRISMLTLFAFVLGLSLWHVSRLWWHGFDPLGGFGFQDLVDQHGATPLFTASITSDHRNVIAASPLGPRPVKHCFQTRHFCADPRHHQFGNPVQPFHLGIIAVPDQIKRAFQANLLRQDQP